LDLVAAARAASPAFWCWRWQWVWPVGRPWHTPSSTTATTAPWRVQRGEKLPWNTLDDYYGYPSADPDYRKTSIYSWASALQACFSLAGYDTGQEAIIFNSFGDDRNSWYFSASRPPADVYASTTAGRNPYFHTALLPGHFGSAQVVNCIDHGSPVVLLLDDGLGGSGDPLGGGLSGQRYVTIYGYAWDGDGRTPVRTLQVDVYDPLGADGKSAGSTRLQLDSLTQAWSATLTGNLVSGRGRLGISREGGI